MENNNNNGRGIFYGVIGVATLVVAIIGATFAYFTATVTRDNAINNVGSTELNLLLKDEKSNFRTDLIPVDVSKDSANFAKFPGITTIANEDTLTEEQLATELAKGKTCRDLKGNSICSIYEFTIENDNDTTAQTVIGSMKVATNGFTNLHYALFKGSIANIASYTISSLDAAGASTTATTSTAGTLIHTGNIKDDSAVVGTEGQAGYKAEGVIAWPNTKESLAPNGTTTYTIVIWLEDTGIDQKEEMKQSFAAGITFTSDTGEGGVTGILSAS